MKRILYLSIFAFVALTSCEDYHASLEGLDTNPTPQDIKTIEYTMTADDYASVASNSTNSALAGDDADAKAALAAIKSQNAFSLDAPASLYAPAFIDATWFAADNGSSVKLTFNTYGELSDEVIAVSAASNYSLSSANYATVWTDGEGYSFFTPSKSAASNLPTILNAQYPDADPGAVMLVEYYAADSEPYDSDDSTTPDTDIPSTGFLYDFDDITATTYDIAIDGLYNIATIGTSRSWNGKTYNSNGYLEMTAYFSSDAEEVEAYLITEPFVVADDMEFSFKHAYGYYSEEGGRVSVLISEDFTPNASGTTTATEVTNATWTDVTSNFTFIVPEGSYGTLTEAGPYSLDSYVGKKIAIALRYNGDGNTTATTTNQIDDIAVTINSASAAPAAIVLPTTQKYATLYQFDGSNWSLYSSAIALQDTDYTAMGSTYGNLSGTQPEDYLATWLSNNYPYALEGDSKVIAFKYYSSTTYVRGDKYNYTGGEWVKDEAMETVTEQFVKSDNKWNFDPSVTLNLTPTKNDEFIMAHYQAVVDWVWENVDVAELGCSNYGEGYVTSYGNNEYYTGSSAYYNNVDLRPSKAIEQCPTQYANMSEDEVEALMLERLTMCWAYGLESLYPDMAPIDGLDVYYTVNIAIYTGTTLSDVSHTMKFEVVGVGDFEYVEGSLQEIE